MSSMTSPLSHELHADEPQLRFTHNDASAPGTAMLIDARDDRIFAILGIDRTAFSSCIGSVDDLALQRFVDGAPAMASKHADLAYYRLDDDTRIACVNWSGRMFITGTDIVRYLMHRYQRYTGYPPVNIKKFEEGVFSDLRRLSPPNDCQLETTRSDFLIHLFNADRVRSKKKQKVFYWASFKRAANALFCDCIERELARIEMASASGMSLEEFIKAGVVPTGGTSATSEANVGGDHDWTVQRMRRSHDFRVSSLDQIHIIRNDIANCFARHLRTPLTKRTQSPLVLDDDLSRQVDAEVDQRTGGAQLPTTVLPPRATPSRPSSTAAHASGGISLSDSSASESTDADFSPFSSKKRKAMASTAATPSPLARGAQRARKSEPVGGLMTPPRTHDSKGRLMPPMDRAYAPDDQYSVSTMSSDEDGEGAPYLRHWTPIVTPHYHRPPNMRGKSTVTASKQHHAQRQHAVWQRESCPPAYMYAHHPQQHLHYQHPYYAAAAAAAAAGVFPPPPPPGFYQVPVPMDHQQWWQHHAMHAHFATGAHPAGTANALHHIDTSARVIATSQDDAVNGMLRLSANAEGVDTGAALESLAAAHENGADEAMAATLLMGLKHASIATPTPPGSPFVARLSEVVPVGDATVDVPATTSKSEDDTTHMVTPAETPLQPAELSTSTAVDESEDVPSTTSEDVPMTASENVRAANL